MRCAEIEILLSQKQLEIDSWHKLQGKYGPTETIENETPNIKDVDKEQGGKTPPTASDESEFYVNLMEGFLQKVHVELANLDDSQRKRIAEIQRISA